jgi:osomolarity two-component system phosphorelay intermediate protein YPD1
MASVYLRKPVNVTTTNGTEPAGERVPTLEEKVCPAVVACSQLCSPPQFAELEASGQVDPSTFQQILEMDDDDDDTFSRQIIVDFFEQAETTFEKMDRGLWVTSTHAHHC